jgi:hypothetical protein|tara:strand:- start:241 stop:810 length:570 start_codon:yes stop_codon:yes gene_type:complete
MYSSISDMIEKRVANQTRGKISHIDNNQEGLVAFYNSLNRNERIKYRVYANNDAYHLDYRTLDASYFDSYDATVAYIEQLQTTGPAITITYQEQIAACWGFAQIVPGVFEAWCLGSQLFNKYPVATTRTAKFVIEQGVRFLAAHRIQLTVLASNKVANNWASVLQFKYEGLMKQFGHDKQDYVMYAKIY